MWVEIALILAFLAFFVFLILKMPFFGRLGFSRRWILLFFVLKLLVSAGVVGVYKHYYDPQTSDMYNYYKGGKVIWSSLRDNPADYFRMVSGIGGDAPHLHRYYDAANHWYKPFNYGLFNDNRTMMRYNAVLNLFTLGSFAGNLVITVFLTFLGLCYLARALGELVTQRMRMFTLVIMCIPTVLFWSSGLLKESLVMMSLGVFLFHWIRFTQEYRIKNLLPALIFAALLVLAKFYIFVALLPAIVFLLFPVRWTYLKQTLAMFSVLLIMLVLFFNSKHIVGVDFAKVMSEKQTDFVKFVNLQPRSGSSISLPSFEPTPSSMAEKLPGAYFNSFMRPHLFEASSAMPLLAALENAMLLLLIVLMIVRFRKPLPEEFRLILFSMSFVLILFALIGLTTPNLGALVRYKMPALPFLVVSVLLCTKSVTFKKLGLPIFLTGRKR